MYSCARSNKSPWSSSLDTTCPSGTTTTYIHFKILPALAPIRKRKAALLAKQGRGRTRKALNPLWTSVKGKDKSNRAEIRSLPFHCPKLSKAAYCIVWIFADIFSQILKVICQVLWTIKVIEMRPIQLISFCNAKEFIWRLLHFFQ